MRKKRNLLDIIINIIIILAFVLAVYWFIQLMFGHTPDLSDFNSILIVMIIGFLFHLYREVGEIKVGIKHSFINIKEDINIIKTDDNLIKKKLKV